MTTKEKEFERLFKEQYSRLYYYALTYLDDAEACKDIVSDVFEQVWQEYASLRAETLKAYLYTCVRNRCINHLRHRQVEDQYLTFYTLYIKEQCSQTTDKEEDERLRRVKTVIEAMPVQRRFVLEECFFHKKTYKEVAAILGITTDGVKKHIVTALKNLRAEFQPN